MEISKLNLSKIKVAIFDFDDTLAIHKDQNYLKKRRSSEDKLLELVKETIGIDVVIMCIFIC